LAEKLKPIEIDILAALLENPQRRLQRREIQNKVYEKYEKMYSKNSFSVILQRRLNHLCNLGFLKKHDLGHQQVYYSLQEEKQKEAIELINRSKAHMLLDKLPVENQIEYVRKLEREVKRYRRRELIKAFNDSPLPARAVHKKLLEMGFTNENLYDVIDCNTNPDSSENYQPPYRLTNIAVGPLVDSFTPEDIEIKIIHPKRKEKIISSLIIHDPAYQSNDPGALAFKPLVLKPIKGAIILGAYKKLIELYREEFEDDWLSWKEEFKISDEDWEIVGPEVHEMMIHNYLPWDIGDFLAKFVDAQKPDAVKRFKSYYLRYGYGPREAEEEAKKQ